MKAIYLVLILIMVLLICGCVNKTRLHNQAAFLKFSGDITDVVLMVDQINLGFLRESKSDHHIYPYTPGMHQITLMRNDIVIFQNNMELVSGETTLIPIPCFYKCPYPTDGTP
jgi:hypothetical protein